MEERAAPVGSVNTSPEVAPPPDDQVDCEGVEVSLDVTVYAAKATAATGHAASKSKSRHDDSDSDFDSDADDVFQVGTLSIQQDSKVFSLRPLDPVATGHAASKSKSKYDDSDSDFDSDADDGFQVGTLSVQQDMSKALSLRPLDPVWASSRSPCVSLSSELEASPIASRSIPSRSSEAGKQMSASSRKSAAFPASSSSAKKNASVRHKFSRSSFGESSEDSDDSSIVADLPSKPPRSVSLSAAQRFASMPAPRGSAAGSQEVRAVASMPTGAGQKVVFHKQATGRRLACSSSSLRAVAQASLTNQDMPLGGRSSVRAQVEAMQLEEVQRQWSEYDRDRGDRPEELAACGTEGCAIH